MDLRHALRTTGAIREFTDRPVDDETVREILDDARFAPSGGNRQAWRVIVVKDAATKEALRDIYLDGWHDYVAHLLAGLTPFSPLATSDERELAVSMREAAIERSRPDGFAESFHNVPVQLVVLADLGALAAVDRDLVRYTFAGGGSIYPFAWNILLAARDRGLGGVMTTMVVRDERATRQLLHIPENFAVATVIALGYPVKEFSQLRRRGVEEFANLDRFDGPAL